MIIVIHLFQFYFHSDITLVSQLSNYSFYQSNYKFCQHFFSKTVIFAKIMAWSKYCYHLLLVRHDIFQASELHTLVQSSGNNISADRIIGLKICHLFRMPLLFYFIFIWFIYLKCLTTKLIELWRSTVCEHFSGDLHELISVCLTQSFTVIAILIVSQSSSYSQVLTKKWVAVSEAASLSCIWNPSIRLPPFLRLLFLNNCIYSAKAIYSQPFCYLATLDASGGMCAAPRW
jgi:hypothetical protein